MFSDEQERLSVPPDSLAGWVGGFLMGVLAMGAPYVFFTEISDVRYAWIVFLVSWVGGALGFYIRTAPRFRQLSIFPGLLLGSGSFFSTWGYLAIRPNPIRLEVFFTTVIGTLPAFLLLKGFASYRSYKTLTSTPDPETHDLGTLKRTYRVGRKWQGNCLLIALGLSIVAGLCFSTAYSYDPRTVDVKMPLYIGEASAAGTLVALLLLMVKGAHRVELHEHGLRWKGLRTWRQVTWKELRWIKDFYFPETYGRRSYLFLYPKVGQRITLDSSLEDYSTLESEICSRYAEALWPSIRESLELGQAIAFGDLELTSQGFRQGKKWLDFVSVASIQVEQHCLFIRQHGSSTPWFQRTLNDIPNGPILLKLLAEIREQRLSHSPDSGQLDR